MTKEHKDTRTEEHKNIRTKEQRFFKKLCSSVLVFFRSRTRARPAGFTLIEAVTAAGVFIVSTVLMTNLYLVFSKAQRSAGTRQKIVSEISFAVEKIAQEIRVKELLYRGSFDYDGSNDVVIYKADGLVDIQGEEKELALVFADKVDSQIKVYYYFNNGSVSNPDCPDGKGLYRFTDDETANKVVCQKLLDINNLEVIDAGFYISPSTNPHPDSKDDCGNSKTGTSFNGFFCTCAENDHCWTGSCNDSQNRCVLDDKQPRVTFYLKVNDIVNNKDIVFQTTVAQRVYKR